MSVLTIGEVRFMKVFVVLAKDDLLMKIIGTILKGCFEIQPSSQIDKRGFFLKTFSGQAAESLGLNPDIKESFVTLSTENTLRGMHLQCRPFDLSKWVCVLDGEV